MASPNTAVEMIQSSDQNRILKPSKRLNHNKYKTSLCRNWKYTGVCAFASGCAYAHGYDELKANKDHDQFESSSEDRFDCFSPNLVNEQSTFNYAMHQDPQTFMDVPTYCPVTVPVTVKSKPPKPIWYENEIQTNDLGYSFRGYYP